MLPDVITLNLGALVQTTFGAVLAFMFKALHNTVKEIRTDLRKYNDAMIIAQQWQIAQDASHSVSSATRDAERDAIWRELNLLRNVKS